MPSVWSSEGDLALDQGASAYVDTPNDAKRLLSPSHYLRRAASHGKEHAQFNPYELNGGYVMTADSIVERLEHI